MLAEAILNHHLTAFGKGDVDEMLKDYTDDSVLVGPGETLRGYDAVRALFSGWFETLFRPGTYAFTMDRLEIEGDFAYIIWHSECEEADVTLGTDTFVAKKGRFTIRPSAPKLIRNSRALKELIRRAA